MSLHEGSERQCLLPERAFLAVCIQKVLKHPSSFPSHLARCLYEMLWHLRRWTACLQRGSAGVLWAVLCLLALSLAPPSLPSLWRGYWRHESLGLELSWNRVCLCARGVGCLLLDPWDSAPVPRSPSLLSNSVSSVRAFQSSQKPENKLAVTSGWGEAGRGRMRKERKYRYGEESGQPHGVLHNAGGTEPALLQ